MKGSKKSSKKNNSVMTVITMVVVACVIVGTFAYIYNREDKEKVEPDVELTEVQKLLLKDFESTYPATPREVVKLYSRFSMCIHNEDLTDEEFEKLGEQVQNLYAKELIEANPSDEYIMNLAVEVAEYQKSERKIKSYAIASGDSIITWKEDGKEFARLLATYSLKEGKEFNTVSQEFLLQKDEAGLYKILGWRLADKADAN
jgi:Na+-transporting NADH:ubiquinone oxidoreductase subunit NqrC